ncbi:hypothetical protein Xcaj_23495 [Xanthomonas axonopodis pv. cajani]|uniref:Uncharacterized protein n=1 Tax=Xanthomonas axonopodis pv. cajani TaxID=487827 RepID=A0ABX3MBY5_9XANT|nr:hypothetical protein [Xanthomonas axonopodis]OOX14034.1 hypothetical protein Xcaj_23495 [Xanthomonas axonopodis pv. cajani]
MAAVQLRGALHALHLPAAAALAFALHVEPVGACKAFLSGALRLPQQLRQAADAALPAPVFQQLQAIFGQMAQAAFAEAKVTGVAA